MNTCKHGIDLNTWCMTCIDEEEKRLSPTGSGAMTCCGGRGAGDQQGSAEDEERSDETGGLARCAGVGEAALIELIAKMESHSDAANEESRELGDGENDERQAYSDGMAHAYYRCAEWLYELLPKPDSDADEVERSGRRNDPAMTRPGETSTNTKNGQ